MSTTRTRTPRESLAGTRLHGLDALRAGALLLGIVLHSILPFMPGMPWLVIDSQQSDAASATAYVIHLFRMPLFMMLAGYFARMSLHRRGTRSFVADRLRRVALPLVVFWPLALGSLIALVLIGVVAGVTPSEPLQDGGGSGGLLQFLDDPAHLWFLWVLLEIYLIILVVRAVARRLLGPDRATTVAERAGAALAGPAGVLLAAVPFAVTMVLQIAMTSDDALGVVLDAGIANPMSFVPEPIGLIAYTGAFAVGWAFHARPDSLAQVGRRRWPYLTVGIITVAGGFLLADPALNPPALLAAPVFAVAAWCLIYALLGLAVRFLSDERPAVRYLADASYWMYIAHLPLLVALEIPLADLDWPIAVKLLLTWVVAGVLLILSYHLLVRSTWIGRMFNGRKHPFTWPPLRRRPAPSPDTA
ncbi:acyltransferase family protein [Myceligenerans halotolerans]